MINYGMHNISDFTGNCTKCGASREMLLDNIGKPECPGSIPPEGTVLCVCTGEGVIGDGKVIADGKGGYK
jgi:hypothetical protein